MDRDVMGSDVTEPEVALLAEHVGSVRADLVRRFRDVLPSTVVETAVTAAAGELQGQVPPQAFGELLHQLAAYRLLEYAAAVARETRLDGARRHDPDRHLAEADASVE